MHILISRDKVIGIKLGPSFSRAKLNKFRGKISVLGYITIHSYCACTISVCFYIAGAR